MKAEILSDTRIHVLPETRDEREWLRRTLSIGDPRVTSWSAGLGSDLSTPFIGIDLDPIRPPEPPLTERRIRDIVHEEFTKLRFFQ